jgi:lipopolysaccharide export system protein LptA
MAKDWYSISAPTVSSFKLASKEHGHQKIRTTRLLRRLILPILLLLPILDAAADDAFRFKGDRLTSNFTAGQEQTVLSGNAWIVSGNLEISADTIELKGKGFRFATCDGAVTVRDTKKDIVLKADEMEYDRTLKTSRFRGLVQLDDASNGVTVRAGLLDYDETSELVIMQTGVRLFKGELICRSDYAVYDREARTLDLSGLPTVNKKRDVYRAGSIHVNLKTEDVFLDGEVSGTIIPENKDKDKKDKDKKDGPPSPGGDGKNPPGPPPSGSPGAPPPGGHP